MATKSSISKQLFEKLLEEQKGQENFEMGVNLMKARFMKLLTTSSLILGMEKHSSLHSVMITECGAL